MKLAAISGSLRAASANSALVRALPGLAPPGMEITIFDGVGDLPHYSPEWDTDTPPASVLRWRGLLRVSDAALFCTPEYAHGMPGSLKNALDWLVSSGEFDGGKPCAALSASPSILGGDKALAWLTQILPVLGADIPPAATFAIPYVRKKMDAQGHVSDPALVDALRAALQSLADQTAKRTRIEADPSAADPMP